MRVALVVILAVCVLASCVTVQPPTQVSRGPGWYTVKRSDTLYSIAWRYGLDYKQLAQWNGIGLNEPIFPGQRLRLIRPADSAVAERESAAETGSAPTPAPDSSRGQRGRGTRTRCGNRQRPGAGTGADDRLEPGGRQARGGQESTGLVVADRR